MLLRKILFHVSAQSSMTVRFLLEHGSNPLHMSNGGLTPISELFESPCQPSAVQSIHILQSICTGVKSVLYSDLSVEIWKSLRKCISEHHKHVALFLPVILTCLPFKIQVDIIQKDLHQTGWFKSGRLMHLKMVPNSDSVMDQCLQCCCFTKFVKQIVQAYSISKLNKNKLEKCQFKMLFPDQWKVFIQWLLPKIHSPITLKEQCRHCILTHLVDSPVKCLAHLCLASGIEDFLIFSDVLLLN